MLRHALLYTLAGAATLTALAGCAPDTLPPPEGSAASASPTTGGPLDGTPEPDSNSASGSGAENGATHYSCSNGGTISARYPDTDHAVVHYQGDDLPMHIAISADGARYVGNDYEWWTRGTGPDAQATLFTHAADGSTGNKVTTCHEQ
ncbi:MAG: MliC family protein [Salinisphaera sp.]|uniref:MliC family protein n=1 Tax=Salinisphaera sp. TaxID=1914330 RepID=UPI003C7A60CE